MLYTKIAAPYAVGMHHPRDRWFKALMEVWWELVAEVELERAVHVPAQRIDLAFEPRARAPELGIVDRMAAMGPGMLEYFASAPNDADIKACIRKRLNYDHERRRVARRHRAVTPPEPRLWILSAGKLRAAVAARVVPMADWPAGFWQSPADEHVHFVALDELPETIETLPLRLLGRGHTLQRGLTELDELSRDHVLNRALPVLIAFRPFIMQDLEKTVDMTAYQRAMALYEEWERGVREDEARRSREDGARAILMRIVSQRFGEVPEHVIARIQHADYETLLRWATQLITARSLDDVLQ